MNAKPNRRVKGGAEKARLKRNADLQAAANNPKQLRLCFPITSNNILVQSENISTRVENSVATNYSSSTSSIVVKENIIGEQCFESTNTNSNFNLNYNATVTQKLDFIKKNPVQPTHTGNINFDVNKMYYRIVSRKKIHRTWLSVLVEDNDLNSSGCTNLKSMYSAIERHEKSIIHTNAVESYFQASKEMSMEYLINRNMMAVKRQETENNIHVLKEVFEIIKFLGRQNLPYRGSASNETISNFDDILINKGNFLEMVQFASKKDAILHEHLRQAIKNSKLRKERLEKNKNLNSKGRGSLVTFLSKTTVDKVISGILKAIRNKIKNELGDQNFSIQMDSTQDVGVMDQASISVRYINDGDIKERLFAIVQSFDGANNMSGQFSGLQSFIKSQNENSIFIWYYSHILNLCMVDICKNIDSKTLFGLLNRLATFFGSSYKRMNTWTSENTKNSKIGKDKLRKLHKVAESNTRWWSRHKALEWVFKGTDCLFPTVISVLHIISTDSSFDNNSTSEALSLLKKLSEFKVILTAHIFLDIFSFVRPTSDYLQTKQLDFLSAWKMVENTKNDIKQISFENIIIKAKQFAIETNEKLSNLKLPEYILVEEKLPEGRRLRKKKQFDETTEDEVLTTPIDHYRVETFKTIIDQLNMSLNERFSSNIDLITDAQILHPSSFDENLKNFPKNGLLKIANLVNIPHNTLVEELVAFSKIYPSLNGTLSQRAEEIYDNMHNNEYNLIDDDSIDEEDEEDDTAPNATMDNLDVDDGLNYKFNMHKKKSATGKQSKCSGCLICCFKLLFKFNMHSVAFTNLYLAYEFILTLSFTEVNCERSFSKLKIIKSRLRSSIGNEMLEAFMLMSVEKDLLEEVNFQEILQYVKQSSSLMCKLLS
ncbi:zinc finger MYM-type protein 1-like [Aphis craccivora]|uniref:Zinc finger MYM-type protein 1-like n=1 Tax=Aphis craccivora TaxID=307492 RepID=A0A6G0XQ18_APHCR|nr:zinc finger MYM-type protein 1-like [Aphis craccivora]